SWRRSCGSSLMWWVSMATEGPNSPGSAVNASAAATPWSTPSNAVASDNSSAVAALAALAFSDRLELSQFGFSVPSNATIDGIEVAIERHASASGIRDNLVQLIHNGSNVGSSLAVTGTNWPTTDAVAIYGG